MTGRQWWDRRLVVRAALVVAGLALAASPGLAVDVVEAWRVPYAAPSAVSIYPADGSCVFVSEGGITRLDENGSFVQEVDGAFTAVTVNAKDNSLWATDETNGTMTHLTSNGSELWQGSGYVFGAWTWTHYLDVNPVDNSLWFSEDPEGIGGWARLIHLGANGALLWQSELDLPTIAAVSVNPGDGSVWECGTLWFLLHDVAHYASDGTLVWSDWAYRPLSVSVDTQDGSVYHTSSQTPAGGGYVAHSGADGSLLWTTDLGDLLANPYAVAANPRDGTSWAISRSTLYYLDPDGNELWHGDGYGQDYWSGAALAVNPRDGSLRVSDTGNGYVIRINVVGLPEAVGGVAAGIGPAPLTVHFEDWSLGTPTSWLWTFGDGTTSTEQNPVHVYTSPGTYEVTLRASNSYGYDTGTCSVTVLPTQRATRAPGYWSKRPEAVRTAFAALTGDEEGTLSLCSSGDCTVTPEDAMAIFWRAKGLRATLAEHLLAARFNNALLKPAPDDIIAAGSEVLCDPSSSNAQLSAALQALAAYNQSGTSQPMIGLNFGRADPRAAKEMAAEGEVPGCVSIAPSSGRGG